MIAGIFALDAEIVFMNKEKIAVSDLMEDLKIKFIQALKLKNVAKETLDPDASIFGGGLGLDSIDALELVVMLEREYGIRIQDMETGRDAFASLRSLATYIAEHRAPCNPTPPS